MEAIIAIAVSVLSIALVILAKPGWGGTLTKNWIAAYMLVLVPVRAVVLLTSQEPLDIYRISSPGSTLEHDVAIAAYQTTAGMLCFLLGYRLVHRRLGRGPKADRDSLGLPAALLILVVSLALMPFQLQNFNNTQGDPTVGGDFTLALAGYAAAGAGSVAAFLFWRDWRRAALPLALAVTTAYLRIALFGAKETALALLAGLLIGFFANSQGGVSLGRALRLAFVVGVAGVAALYVFAGPLLLNPANSAVAESPTDRLALGVQVAGSRSYGADALIAVNRYLDDGHELLLGASLAEITYSWVPRQLWPDKPFSFTQRLGASVFAYSSQAGHVFFAPTLAGEWLLNFGTPGLLVGFVLFGFVSALVDSRTQGALRVLWLISLTHAVEGGLVAQFWLALPFILGGVATIRAAPTTQPHVVESHRLRFTSQAREER